MFVPGAAVISEISTPAVSEARENVFDSKMTRVPTVREHSRKRDVFRPPEHFVRSCSTNGDGEVVGGGQLNATREKYTHGRQSAFG